MAGSLKARDVVVVVGIVTCIKVLLFPAYRSTDFEVHRNWLAITHSLPISKWYTEATSIWTLDYPPFFAWFEWALSHVAKFFDPKMLVVRNLEYASLATVVFQRSSVIVTDFVYISAAFALAKSTSQKNGRRRGLLLFVLLACNAGLLIVDHIHFQYNGILMGMMLWSIHYMQNSGDWLSGVWYTVLLNMKHLFVYCGPLYAAHIFSHWCQPAGPVKGTVRLAVMGFTVLGITAISFGPFYLNGTLPKLFNRLFPFDRGLTHSYWAANWWAMYTAADQVLKRVVPSSWLLPVEPGTVDPTSGVVGISHLYVLPWMDAETCLGMVLFALAPCILSMWWRPQPMRFAGCIAYALLSGFWLGYHVHEKAILYALIPLAIPAVISTRAAEDFVVLSCAGHYGLFPLLIEHEEYGIKVVLALGYYLLAAHGLADAHYFANSARGEEGGALEATARAGSGALGYRTPDRMLSTGGLVPSFNSTPLNGTPITTPFANRPSPLGIVGGGAGMPPGSMGGAPFVPATNGHAIAENGEEGAAGSGKTSPVPPGSTIWANSGEYKRRTRDVTGGGTGAGDTSVDASPAVVIGGNRERASGLVHRSAAGGPGGRSSAGGDPMRRYGSNGYATAGTTTATTTMVVEPVQQITSPVGATGVVMPKHPFGDLFGSGELGSQSSIGPSDYGSKTELAGAGSVPGALPSLGGSASVLAPAMQQSSGLHHLHRTVSNNQRGSLGGSMGGLGATFESNGSIGGSRFQSELGGRPAGSLEAEGVGFVFDDPAVVVKQPFSVSRLIGAGPLLPLLPALYCLGFVPLELYNSFMHYWIFGEDHMHFLPLMLTSLYCSLGVGWVWVRMLVSFLTGTGYV